MLGRNKARRETRNDEQLALSWQCLSLLLEYPGDDIAERLEAVGEVMDRLPAPVAGGIGQFTHWLFGRDLQQVRTTYVDTFDVTRRCSLYLTYFAHGDTRKRGLALVQIKQAYQRAGMQFEGEELPDHLCVVLEFGAQVDVGVAWRLLTEHRVGIEMVRMALTEAGSPWAHLLDALDATLPPVAGDDQERLIRLISEGPPGEEVGIDTTPYAMDPGLHQHLAVRSRTDLGPTIAVGAPR